MRRRWQATWDGGLRVSNKTVETGASVEDFLAGVSPPVRLADARVLIELMARLSGEPPRLWGPSIIGFGSQHYRYDSGREGDMPRIAFSPRKPQLVLYVGIARPGAAPFLARLGKHKTGKGCLYIKTLADIDMAVLEALLVDRLATIDAPGAG